MVYDFDDYHENNHLLDRLHQLKELNPRFKATVFAVPALGSDTFWESTPDWLELAVHGWTHESVHECVNWTSDKMRHVMHSVHPRFVTGFKAPGWQISDGCYEALLSEGWWVADQPYNDHRRPAGLRVHLLSETASSGRDPDHWHGHIQNDCGNGIQETWGDLTARVSATEVFQYVSEAAR